MGCLLKRVGGESVEEGFAVFLVTPDRPREGTGGRWPGRLSPEETGVLQRDEAVSGRVGRSGVGGRFQ